MQLPFHVLRVLGSLIEKEIVTPDAYPLSLNALLAACNQRSSRDPVTDLTEDEVRGGLDILAAHELVTAVRDGGRVVKYEHRIRTVLTLRRDETAVICLLLLRGAQTPGELRSRADRMYTFDDLPQLQSTLDRLAARDTPLVGVLARSPGSREARWVHLLGGAPAATELSGATSQNSSSSLDAIYEKIAELERRIQLLEDRTLS
jgi:uncharacterized protein YceH (UPF0502 family)